MVWMCATRYKKHGNQFIGGPLHFAAGEDTLGVTVELVSRKLIAK
jgi:hypothetical protein